MSEAIIQKEIIFPGSQLEHSNLLDVNEKYFIYCSTYLVYIFNKSDLSLRNILGDNNDHYISLISLNKSPKEEVLALYYNKDILIYNLLTCNLSYSIPISDLKQIEFNKDSKLLILNNKGELYLAKIEYKRYAYLNKVNIDDNFCNCFKWYPFNNNEFAYSTNKNKIYYYSLIKNHNVDNNSIIDNIKNIFLGKCVQIKDDENFFIQSMEFYNLDQNYKYLLVGTTNSKIYLLDLNTYEITNRYNKVGKTPIKYLFWLNNQPGSFISINEKSDKYFKFNVSKSNYLLMGKFSDYNISSLSKYDNESNFLASNRSGDVFILNEMNKQIKYIVKDSHNQSILDLKINPNNEDIFITGSYDGNIRLYSLKDNYKLIHLFNTNKNINSTKTTISNSENCKLNGYFSTLNNKNIHITSLAWSPKNINLFASGDSRLCLRIFDISIKKQIISYQCLIDNSKLKMNSKKNNFIIQGIDWNEYDNIIVCANICIFLFSFVINNNIDKNKYSLILITELKLNNFVYNPIFESHNEYIIAPSEDGNIYFYSTINDKLGKIIDISSTPYKEIKGHKKRVNNITFNNSKSILASASEDMKIGLYNIIKNKETPMSKITETMNHFLVGQESPINQVSFLIDDTLLSGAKNGTICVWDIQKLQLKYKLNENVNDIYCLNSFNKYPFLFISAGNDCSIRFWNLNYKINLEQLLLIDKGNPQEIEKFIKNYFYEEEFDIFFDLLNEKNKEKKLVANYLNKSENLKNDYSKFTNDKKAKNKINFSLKTEDKNNILDKLIKESAVIQEWKIFCELCILRNKWEDAICFAPKVSLEYWQDLMNKYEKYINSEDYAKNNIKENIDYNIQSNFEDKEFIDLLKGNNYTKIIDLCIKKKDFQNALMIWLMQKSKKEEEILPNKNKIELNNQKIKNDNINIQENNNLIDTRIINNLYNDIKLDLKNNENIKKIFDEESLTNLKEGKRIKSIINYLYYDDKKILLKVLSQSNFIELGYLLCNDSDNKEINNYNDYFLMMLFEKYENRMNDNLLCLLINKMHDEDYKNIFGHIILNKNNIIKLNKEKSELIKILEKNDINSLQKIIHNYKQECFNKLLDIFFEKDNKVKINENDIKTISLKLNDFLKLLILIKIKRIELNKDLKLDILLSIMLIECLNYNYKSLICLIIEYLITNDIFNDKIESNKKIFNFIFDFINYVQNNFKENKIVKKYKFSHIHQQKYISISSSCNQNKINIDSFNKVREIMHFNNIYNCNINEMKYFYLEDEIYPKKTKKDNNNLSSFSNENIKSDVIKLDSGNYASLEEYLEMNKYIYIKKI